MFKLTKKHIEDFAKTKERVSNAEKFHDKNIDKISKLIKNKIPSKYRNYKIEKIDICYDSYYKYKNKNNQYEWVEIDEDLYDNLLENEKRNCKQYHCDSIVGYESNFKKEIINTPDDLEFHYYQKQKKKSHYLTVYLYDTWGYGGFDEQTIDFLITDLLGQKELRKEKIEKILKDVVK